MGQGASLLNHTEWKGILNRFNQFNLLADTNDHLASPHMA